MTIAGEGNCLGYAAHDKSGKLTPFRFNRRAVGPDDVKIRITHAGICHSDLHTVRDEWGGCKYPMVPGHEIVGIVEEVGANVTEYKIGDKGAIGCMVNSCGECENCAAHNEQYCLKGAVFTYNSEDRDGTITMGGYSQWVVCNKKFVVRFPDALPMDAGVPLLCAGITVYSPLKYYGLDKPGLKIGVVGLGGLGHMAVKFAKAFGAHVTVISTSESKRKEATTTLGADAFLVSKNEADMKAAEGTLDGVVDTVSAQHDLHFGLLKTNGKYVCVGAPPQPYQIAAFTLIFKRITLGGSLIGGIQETQEMLDFCAKHNVVCMIEKVKIDYVNEAYDRMARSDVRYRFVIDIENSLK